MGGLVEDLTHKVTPRARLLLACLSSAFVYFVFQVGVTRTDIPPLDAALAIPGVALLLTMLVVAGFINAVNIIDGFHGLASGTVIIMLLGLAGLAWLVNDGLVFRLCLVTATATLGFAMWNWPLGKIFLGDAGAYILGFWVIELGLMIVNRCTNFSPMAPLLVGLYPIVETLFSMYRRKFVRSHPMGHPDSLHLHTLLFRRVVTSNYKVAPYLWTLTILNSVAAYEFAHNTAALLSFMLMFAAFYVMIYAKLVRFETPKLLLK